MPPGVGPHWIKQCYFALGPLYPSIGIMTFIYQNEYDTLTFFKQKKVEYKVSETQLGLFEDELVKVNNTLELPFDNLKIDVTPTNATAEDVLGLTAFRQGVNYLFPIRMLVESNQEFRERISEIISGGVGYEFPKEIGNLISDEEINDILLSESARRFLYRRSIHRSTSYAVYALKYVVWVACVGICYGVFALVSRVSTNLTALCVATPAVIALHYKVMSALRPAHELEFDRIVYSVDDSYVQGCKEFLTSCIKFGLLASRFSKDDSTRLFDSNGNPVKDYVAYTERLKLVQKFEKLEASRKKKKNLRLLGKYAESFEATPKEE